MPDLANRAAYERVFTDSLSQLKDEQRQRLQRLLASGQTPDQPYWDRNAQELAAHLMLLLQPVFAASANAVGGDSLANHRAGWDWAQQKAAKLAQQINDGSREMFAADVARQAKAAAGKQEAWYLAWLLLQGHDGGATRWSRPEAGIATQVLNSERYAPPVLDRMFGPKRASDIAVTSITGAHSAGQLHAGKELGLTRSRLAAGIGVGAAILDDEEVTTAVWTTEEDDSVCPVCDDLDGTGVEEWGEDFPDGPPAHPNCVLPGNFIVPFGEASAGAKSFYHGRCVEVGLANGRKFTCTDNHPVLTAYGWVPAKLLREGGYVLCAADPQRVSSAIDPNNDYRPARIEEIFGSLRKSSGMLTARMKVATEDFHGDGQFFHGDVEIVGRNCLLRRDLQAAINQHRDQRSLLVGHVAAPGLASQRLLHTLGKASRSSARRGMGAVKHGMPGLFVGFAPPNQHGFRTAARGYSGLDETPPQCGSANSSGRCQRLLGGSGSVLLDQVFQTQGRSSSPFVLEPSYAIAIKTQMNTRRSSAFTKRLEIDARFSQQFVERFASEVAAQQIVKIRGFSYSGHVFDLQCDTYRLYACNTAIVSNCRCWLEYQQGED